MKKYYFTYGTEGHPFYGGWTLVQAESEVQAIRLFRAVHPDKYTGFANCAAIYTEESFSRTKMARLGHNFGYGCHETISVQREG